jgi:hypothetical protein
MYILKIIFLTTVNLFGILRASEAEVKHNLLIQTWRPGGQTVKDPLDSSKTINNYSTTVISIPYSGTFADIINAFEQKNPTPEGHAVAIQIGPYAQTPNTKYAYGQSDDKNTFGQLGNRGSIYAKVEKIIQWKTQVTGDLFPDGLELSIKFIPTYNFVRYLKEKIRALVDGIVPVTEQNYTVDITKNGTTLIDSDRILPAPPNYFNNYGIVLNKTTQAPMVSPSTPKTKASTSWWSFAPIQRALSNLSNWLNRK